MIIKKYVGKTEEEATALARKELGQGIVIMNVRPVKRTGFLSFLKAQKTEVTVALEEDKPAVRPAAQPAAKPAEAPMPSTADIARAANAGKIPPLKVSGMAVPQAPTEAPAPAPETKPVPDNGAKAQEERNDAIEKKLDNLHNLLEQRIVGGEAKPSGIERARGKEEEAKEGRPEEASAAKEREAVPEAEEEESETLSFIKLLYNTLLENEVDERYANDLTEEAGRLSGPDLSLDAALASVYQKMVLKFGKPETITPAREGAKAEIFIGPTGVGKTTTIAKLASRLHLQEKKKVALLTVDTYRIAAAEQLRTYASIMETPFRVIYSVDEMKQALQDFKDYDFIMIDTAGHSLHNDEQRDNIAAFIEAVREETESENFLVLSATTKLRDLIEITEAYAKMVDYRLIFTKMDETGATGNLYNIRIRTGAPMSYITNGQDVPDDIDVFNAQKIVRGLLGGNRSE